MIERIYDEKRLTDALGEKRDLFSGKIWALYAAYGFNYDFCRFYAQDNGAVIGSYYGKATVFCPNEADYVELSRFLSLPEFSEALMELSLCEKTGLSSNVVVNNIVRFTDSSPRISDINKEEVDNSPDLGKVYEILKDGFDIDYNMWYTDISHNTRHGVSVAYTYNNAATVTKMFTYGEVTFLSFVAAKKEQRGKGEAKSLVRRVSLSEREAGREIYLICRDAVLGFYEKCGFTRIGASALISRDL